MEDEVAALEVAARRPAGFQTRPEDVGTPQCLLTPGRW
jgi:hypothetical protein